MTTIYRHAPPSVAGPLLVSFVGLALTSAFGALAASALTGQYPAWLQTVPLDGIEARTLLVVVGVVNGLLGVLVTTGYLARACHRLYHRLGLSPACSTVGACRLVENEDDLWGLVLDLSPAENLGIRRARQLAELSLSLFFRLDEGAVAELRTVLNPGDILELDWLDLPLSAGGPSLLEVRSASPSFTAAEGESLSHAA